MKYHDFEEWQKAVRTAHKDVAIKLKFKGRIEHGKDTISAEIPNEDRCYGVWDQDKEEGVILATVKLNAANSLQEQLDALKTAAHMAKKHAAGGGQIGTKPQAYASFVAKVKHMAREPITPELVKLVKQAGLAPIQTKMLFVGTAISYEFAETLYAQISLRNKVTSLTLNAKARLMASLEDPISNGVAFDTLMGGKPEETTPLVQQLTDDDGGLDEPDEKDLLIDDLPV